MPKHYTVEFVKGNAEGTCSDGWWVNTPTGTIGMDGGWCDGYGALTTAEASIIAFALNAVAEGRLLFSSSRHSPDVEYEGPTEGVAP